MEDEICKKIKLLEAEIAQLKGSQTDEPTGLRALQESENTRNSPGRFEAEEDLLFYLKSILGFSIKHHKNTIILRSVYSFAAEDTFELEVLNNKLVLKNTNYLLEWSEFFNIYIKNGRSYCAFFAAVTLELYNRKTFG